MKKPCVVLLLIGATAAACAATPTATAPPAASTPASDNARTQRFTHRDYVPGTLTLLKAQGAVGRTEAIGDDFPVQLRFAGDNVPLDCRIHLTKADQKVQPGETAVVAVRCPDPHRVYNHGFAFEAFENGRKIGDGTLRP